MGCGGSKKGAHEREADDLASLGSALQRTSSTSVAETGQNRLAAEPAQPSRPAATTAAADAMTSARLSPRRAANGAILSPRQDNNAEHDKLEAKLAEAKLAEQSWLEAQAALQKQLQDSKAECDHLRLNSRDLLKSHKDLVTRLQNPGVIPSESLSLGDDFERSERQKRQVRPGADLRGESLSLAAEVHKSRMQQSQEIEELRGKLRNVECTSAESTQKCEFLQKRASELEEMLNESETLNESYMNPDSPRRPGDANICFKERQLMEQSQNVGYFVPRSNLQDADSICFGQACGTFDTLNFDNLKLCARAVVFI